MGDGRIFLKNLRALPLIKIYRMSLLSARSISLDSTFNEKQRQGDRMEGDGERLRDRLRKNRDGEREQIKHERGRR
jgi:hypothetical protein